MGDAHHTCVSGELYGSQPSHKASLLKTGGKWVGENQAEDLISFYFL
jgi:hypothetical protein